MHVITVGGGPCGMMAALTAAQSGHAVTLLEQNEKLGKKLFITGKGRCNVTNAGGRDAFFNNIPNNARFLYSAYAALPSEELMALFEGWGVPLKVERGDRVFPVSDHSSDIIRALEQQLKHAGVQIRLRTAVRTIDAKDGRACGVTLANGERLAADAVILATGGNSYKSTGAAGDGYRFLAALGHEIVPPRPALIPLETVETWPYALSGLTLKNVTLTAYSGGKKVYSELGELLLTHFGVSGPLVLSASSRLTEPAGAKLTIDLKPGLSPELLDARLVRDVAAARQKSIANAFSGLLPHKLLPVVLDIAGIDGGQTAGELNKTSRRALAKTLKALPLTVKCARPLDEAIITRGGVSVKEISPSTLESKRISGLYVGGELLDVDAYTGGFNLQIAWCTGRLAGQLKGGTPQ